MGDVLRKRSGDSCQVRRHGVAARRPRQNLRPFPIPLLGSIPAGLPDHREQTPSGFVSVDVATLGLKPTRRTFAVRMVGDSMIGRHILPGDIIVLEHGSEPQHGQIVAALHNGSSTVKTFVVKDGKPYLRAENPKHPNLIPAHDLMIQGVLRVLIRNAE